MSIRLYAAASLKTWRSALAGLAGLALATATFAAPEAPKPQPPQTTTELFQTTKVWNIHLTFTPEQWAAMEPKQPERGAFNFGGRNARPAQMGPGMILSPLFLQQGDANKDGKLSREEFAALGRKWFAEWDKENTGQLSADQLRTSLDAAMTQTGPPMPPRSFLMGQEGQRNGLASAQGIEFEYVRADLEFEGQTIKEVGVRYKGNGTWMMSRGALKRSMKIDLNQYVKGQKLAGHTQLNLHSSVTDPSWMNEVLSHRLYRDAGVAAPRSAYARVYVTVPGKHDRQYLGLYSMIEDIGKAFAEEHFNSKKGAIFKPVTPAPFTDMGNDWARYNQTYDPKTDLSEKQIRRMIELCKLVSHATDAEFAARLPDYVDLDQFARYMAVTVYLSTLDSILSIGQNYYVYLHPKTQKLQFIPWDLDHSFGQFGMGANEEQREKLSIHRPWRGDIRFLDRIYKLDAFKKLYIARLEEFSQGIFKPERLHAQVDEVAAAIRPAVKDEAEQKLTRFNAVVSGQPAGPDGFFAAFRAPPVKPIKGFVTARTPAVIEQLAGSSQGISLDGGGFGGPGGRGGPSGPGGQANFSPGRFVAPGLMTALDADRNGQLTRDEFAQGFDRWFTAWDEQKTGLLEAEQIQLGLNQILMPPGGIPPGQPPGGPGAAPGRDNPNRDNRFDRRDDNPRRGDDRRGDDAPRRGR